MARGGMGQILIKGSAGVLFAYHLPSVFHSLANCL